MPERFWRGTEARLRALNTQLKARLNLPRASRAVGVPGLSVGPSTTDAIEPVRTTEGDFEARIPDEVTPGQGGIPAHDASASKAQRKLVTD